MEQTATASSLVGFSGTPRCCARDFAKLVAGDIENGEAATLHWEGLEIRPDDLSRRASGCERLSGHPSCAGASAPRQRAAGITGSFGTGEIADMAVMGVAHHRQR